MTNQNIVLPAIALRGTTILPGMIVHFDVSRERSVKAIEAAMLHDQKIFLVTQIDPEVESPDLAGVYHVGTIAYIKQVVKLPQNLLRVLVEGTGRATLVKFEQEFPFIRSEITPVDEEEMQMPEPVMEAMHRSLKELFHRYCMENGKVSKELVAQILNIDNVEELVEQIAVNIPLSYQNKQKILEALTLEERYEVLGAILGNEIEIMQIGRDLQKKVKARIDKNQREYILREQLKLIREELGEDNTADDAEEFKKKLQELQAGDEVKEKISKEIERFKNTNSNVSENAVLRGYIETMLALPWEKKSTDSDDLKEAWKVLQEGHYGLKDVKERVMEFLSVRKLTHKGKSPILCLVGPPGTGKTSIARSIAEAMHKKYVRICLGGVRDEAEIRGHRKTYVGAMPGRITAALQQAGVSNPLMLLDEIDKTSSDYKGDTSAALLEVLDPEQNSRFMDHYIEVPQDLSEVLFIATANDVQGIPRPLLDRMELIEIAGYTENEKEHIAKEHLIPKQMEENGIEKGKLTIQSAALKKIINNYTKEAGVRNLERTIGQICRKTARLIMEEDKKKAMQTAKELKELNDLRKSMTENGVKAALDQAMKYEAKGDKVLVLYLPDCHESIAGIIAGRIKDRLNHPVFVLTDAKDGIKGSGRSIEEYSMFEEMMKVKEVFTKFGGHPMAAGCSLEKEDLKVFRKKINENCTLDEKDFAKKVQIDIDMPVDYITMDLIHQLSVLEPFGKENKKPLFAHRKLKIERVNVFGKNKNVIKLALKSSQGTRIDGMIFEDETEFREKMGTNKYITCTYYPVINEYQGYKSLQINIQNYFFAEG